MSDESQIRSWLVACLGSPSLLGDRIFPDVAPWTEATPQESPYLVYSLISDTPENHLADPPAVANLRIQMDIYADTRAGTNTLAALLRGCLNSRGYELNSQGGFEEETRLYRYTMDWSFWLPR